MNKEELRDLAAQVAGYLVQYGWKQNSFGQDGSPRCLLGAIGSCTEDFWAKENLANDLLDGEVIHWNDKPGRTQEEVIGLLQDYAEGRK